MIIQFNFIKIFSSCFSAPLKYYGVLIVIAIISLLIYLSLNKELEKNISMAFFSSSICILITSLTVEWGYNRRKKRETYEIRKSILIRSNYILGLIIELWSGLVERSITKYDGDDIFTKKYFDLVDHNINMKCIAPGICGSIIYFYDLKRTKILYLINNWIQTYGSNIDPKLLSILSRIELCNMLQYDADRQSQKNYDWVNDIFSKNNQETGHKFYIPWEKLREDFNIFRELEETILDLKYEFKNDSDLNIISYSLNYPIFKEKFVQHSIIEYNYDQFYGLASKFDIKMLSSRIDELQKQLEFFMKEKGVMPQKSEAQSLMNALLEAKEKD